MLDIINNIIGWALVFSIVPLFWYSTGWNSLAERYKTTQSPPEIVLNKQSARLMKATNTRIIDVGVCEDGLYMAKFNKKECFTVAVHLCCISHRACRCNSPLLHSATVLQVHFLSNR